MEDLKKEIEDIKIRNKRVELDKKWETSYTRKICICILKCKGYTNIDFESFD